MLSFKPNPDMSVEQAHQVIIDFLNAPNDFSEEIPNETLQSVIDAVFSIKKIKKFNEVKSKLDIKEQKRRKNIDMSNVLFTFVFMCFILSVINNIT